MEYNEKGEYKGKGIPVFDKDQKLIIVNSNEEFKNLFNTPGHSVNSETPYYIRKSNGEIFEIPGSSVPEAMQKGFEFIPRKDALPKPAPTDISTPEPSTLQKSLELAGAGIHGIGSALGSDIIGKGLATLMGEGEAYNEGVQTLESEHPIMTTAGKIAGTVAGLGASGISKAASEVGQVATKGISSLLGSGKLATGVSKAGGLATTGAIEGAVMETVSGVTDLALDKPDQAVENIMMNIGLSAIASPVLSIGGQALVGLVKGTKNTAEKILQKTPILSSKTDEVKAAKELMNTTLAERTLAKEAKEIPMDKMVSQEINTNIRDIKTQIKELGLSEKEDKELIKGIINNNLKTVRNEYDTVFNNITTHADLQQPAGNFLDQTFNKMKELGYSADKINSAREQAISMARQDFKKTLDNLSVGEAIKITEQVPKNLKETIKQKDTFLSSIDKRTLQELKDYTNTITRDVNINPLKDSLDVLDKQFSQLSKMKDELKKVDKSEVLDFFNKYKNDIIHNTKAIDVAEQIGTKPIKKLDFTEEERFFINQIKKAKKEELVGKLDELKAIKQLNVEKQASELGLSNFDKTIRTLANAVEGSEQGLLSSKMIDITDDLLVKMKNDQGKFKIVKDILEDSQLSDLEKGLRMYKEIGNKNFDIDKIIKQQNILQNLKTLKQDTPSVLSGSGINMALLMMNPKALLGKVTIDTLTDPKTRFSMFNNLQRVSEKGKMITDKFIESFGKPIVNKAPVLTNAIVNHNNVDEYINKYQNLSNNPQLQNGLLKQVPNVQQELHKKAVTIEDFMKPFIPKKQGGFGIQAKVSNEALNHFNQMVLVVEQPQQFLEQITKGYVPSKSQIDMFKTLYPNMYNKLKESYQEKIASGQQITSADKVRIQKFFYDDVSFNSNPQNLKNQEIYKQPPPTPSSKGSMSKDAISRMSTESQNVTFQ